MAGKTEVFGAVAGVWILIAVWPRHLGKKMCKKLHTSSTGGTEESGGNVPVEEECVYGQPYIMAPPAAAQADIAAAMR